MDNSQLGEASASQTSFDEKKIPATSLPSTPPMPPPHPPPPAASATPLNCDSDVVVVHETSETAKEPDYTHVTESISTNTIKV